MLSWMAAVDSLKGGKVQPVHLLVGTDYALVRMYIQTLQKTLGEASGDTLEVSRFRFEEEGAGGALFACQSLSLFSTTTLVVLENCTAFLAAGKSKHDTSELEAYLADPIPDRTLVITVAGEKLDERKKIAKAAKKFSVVDCNAPKDDVATQLLHEIARSKGIELDEAAMHDLWRRTASVAQAESEMQKLWTFTAGHRIQAKDVAELVTAPLEDNVFAWIDGVVTGDVERTFRVLSDVQRAGHDPFALFALIARQLRLMWYAKVLGEKGYSSQQVAGKAGAHPYAMKVAGEQARGVLPTKIEHLLTVVADAEYDVKSGRREIAQALDYVVLSCAAAK